MEIVTEIAQWLLLLFGLFINWACVRKITNVRKVLGEGIENTWERVSSVAEASLETSNALCRVSGTVQGYADVLNTHKKAVEFLLKQVGKEAKR